MSLVFIFLPVCALSLFTKISPVILVVAAAVLGILFSLLKWHRSGKEAGK